MQVILFCLQVKIWEMQKSMKKGKYTHNLIPRNTFLMGSPQAAGSLIPPPATHVKGQEHQTFPHSLYLPINPIPTLFQKDLQMAARQWISLLN